MTRQIFRTAGFAVVVGLCGISARAYDISGVVVDARGDAVANAQLWISQDRAVRTETADVRGRFAFNDVAVGPIELVARKQGFALGGLQGQVIGSQDVQVVLQSPAKVTLRIIDPQSRPIEGARLLAMAVGDAFSIPVEDLVEHGFPSIRSDDAGVITIDELPADSFARFSIGHRNFAVNNVPTLPVGTVLDIRLPLGVKVRGRVVNERGEPVLRARVSIYQAGLEVTEVLTDADGFYSTVVPHGFYNVAVRHLDYAIPDPAPLRPPASSEEAAEVNLVLPPPHVIRGSVIGPDRKPVAGTKISYVARDIIFAEAFSDALGGFSITVGAGKGALYVTPPPRMVTVARPEIPFEIAEARAVSLEPIELDRLPEIRGELRAERGVDLANIVVTTFNVSPPVRTLSDDSGAFVLQLEQMPREGTLQLRAEHPLRFLRRDFEFRIARGKSAEERLRSFEPNVAATPSYAPNKLAHMVGDAAPELQCKAWFNVDGRDGLSLSELRGKVVALAFWGGWDRTGIGADRLNLLETLHGIYKDVDDVAIVGIHDASNSAGEVADYVRTYGVTFPVGLDADPFVTFDAYNVNAIPEIILIDKAGILRYYYAHDRLLELIKHLRRAG